MAGGRIVIIPFLHGRVGADGTLVEAPIEDILEKWLERHPEFRGPEWDLKIVRGTMHLVEEDITTDLVRVTAKYCPELAGYDPADDADLYEEFLAEKESSAPPEFYKIWIQQCEAAQQIEADYGTEKAIPRRLGALGHVADAESHEACRSQMDESEKLREDARNLILLDWARQLLVDPKTD